MRTVHVCGLDFRTPYCMFIIGVPVVNNWGELKPGDRPCLRCVRRLNRLRINARVPSWMIPAVPKAKP